MIKATFGKGKYFIGDICYALDEKIYDKIWGKKYLYEDGEYEVKGEKFVVAGTAHGDGCYMGSDGTKYGVDAGVIGIVPSKLFKKDKKQCSFHGGRLVTVKKELNFEAYNGIFRIVIDGDYSMIDTKN